MLKHLHIRNLAIIDELELNFDDGFSALTGETGAGKSILIDAIGLIIGTRADSALVRGGQEKAEISAEFSTHDAKGAQAWLSEQEMLDADEQNACVIRRVVYAEGRTRAFVNGNPVNAGQLRELGETLIEIFGQSESQTLLRNEVQRGLLDDYGNYQKLLSETSLAARACSDIERAMERIRQAGQRDPAQLDYLRFQIQELAAFNLQDGEIERLDADYKQLSNSGRLIQEGNQALELLYGGEAAVYDQLSNISSILNGLASLHDGFAETLALSDNAQTQIREAANSLRKLLDRLDLDPNHLAEVERRLSTAHELARKHRVKPSELCARRLLLETELSEMEQSVGTLDELQSRFNDALKNYQSVAQKLSAERRKAAGKFGDAVSVIVRQLGMANAQLVVTVEATADTKPRLQGQDEVRFDFSANPGQPPRSLAKVASGGELSRVSLAIQVVGSRSHNTPTMIFDEVDAGIGGATAEIVGQKLKELGEGRQVLCVTHLAQVAAQSGHHFGIRKEVRSNQTYTRVRALLEKERVEELARMQGGVEITASALDHARELLQRATSQ